MAGSKMQKQVIRAGVPETGGPINIAVRHGDMVYISGLPPFTPEFAETLQAARREGRPLPKYPDIPFDQQVRIVMDAMKKIMETVGSDMDHLIKVVVWLRDQTQSEVFDRIYREYFSSPEMWPSRTRMQAGRTPLDMGLEVDAIGYIPARKSSPRKAVSRKVGVKAAAKKVAAKTATRSGAGTAVATKKAATKKAATKKPIAKKAAVKSAATRSAGKGRTSR